MSKVFGSVDSAEMIDEDAFEINGLVDMFFRSKFVDTNQCWEGERCLLLVISSSALWLNSYNNIPVENTRAQTLITNSTACHIVIEIWIFLKLHKMFVTVN